MRLKLFVLFLIVIFCLSSVSVQSVQALCPEIILGKTIFIPEETFQAEIKGDFNRDITAGDISLFRKEDNVKLPVDVFITKISDTKFFAFFDIPNLNIDVSEDYEIKVAALCVEGFRVRTKDFTIKKTIASYYQDLKTEIGGLWPYLSVEDHASALAAFSYDAEYYEQGRQKFNSKNCPDNCNVIENSLATIAIKEQEFITWLNDNKDKNGDVRDMAYALFALKNVGEEINVSDIAWLQANAQNDEEKAILVYLSRENYLDLISRQSFGGYWFKENEPDIITTSMAVFALKNIVNNNQINGSEKVIVEDSISNAQDWLLENFNEGNKKEKSFILYYAFPKENIEAIMSVWPGIVKVDSPDTFSLILHNKGKNNINSLIEVMGNNMTSSIAKDEIKNIEFSVPLMTTPDARTLFQQIKIYFESPYGYSSSYKIPLIIFTQKGEENIGGIGTNETNISEQEEEEIKEELNQTNKTTQQEQTLIELPLVFDETEIIKNITVGQSITVTLKLDNKYDQELRNIKVQKSSPLINVVEISPAFITKMAVGETKNIVVTIAPTKTGTFSGTVGARVKINDIWYENSIPITVIAEPGTGIVAQTCQEMGGRECKEDKVCSIDTVIASDTFRCCIPPGECKKPASKTKLPLYGIIIFIVVIVALLAVLLVLTRKKKKQMSEILEEAKQKYETKFQRGLPR